MRLTRRFIVSSLDNIPLSKPIRYERYYINDKLRVQKKGNSYQKEILNEENVLVEKKFITEEEFIKLKEMSYSKIIRDSYLYLKDNRVSIKSYYDSYNGLNRVEVKFLSQEEMNMYIPEFWMGREITYSPLAFDNYLSKLNKEEFLIELHHYI